SGAGEHVDVAVSVGVIQDRAFPALDAQLAEEGDALHSRSQVPRLGVEGGLGLGTGDVDTALGFDHGCVLRSIRSWMYSAIAPAAASRNGAKLGQSLMSISTGRSGTGNATSPPNTSSPRRSAASKATACSAVSLIGGRSPGKAATGPYPRKKRPSATP